LIAILLVDGVGGKKLQVFEIVHIFHIGKRK